jgi:hypothetical protein
MKGKIIMENLNNKKFLEMLRAAKAKQDTKEAEQKEKQAEALKRFMEKLKQRAAGANKTEQ